MELVCQTLRSLPGNVLMGFVDLCRRTNPNAAGGGGGRGHWKLVNLPLLQTYETCCLHDRTFAQHLNGTANSQKTFGWVEPRPSAVWPPLRPTMRSYMY